ncbi:MAG: twin-arginine translocase TatA/TatE family subunit [Pseudomonadota bacterium]
MAPSIWQIAIVVVLLVLLFGRGKISALMGDVAKGIKSFKKGMSEDPDQDTEKLEAKSEEPIDVTPAAEVKKDQA